jgi:hypothetical protein
VNKALGTRLRRHHTQHDDIQYDDIQHGDIQHDDIQHDDIQYDDIQHDDIQHDDIQHDEIQHKDNRYVECQAFYAECCGALEIVIANLKPLSIFANFKDDFSSKKC